MQGANTVGQSTGQFSQTVTQSTGLPVKENTKNKCKMQDCSVYRSTGLPVGENTNTVMSDKDKEVARCKVRDASKETKYKERCKMQMQSTGLPVTRSAGLPVKENTKKKCKMQDCSVCRSTSLPVKIVVSI